MTMQELKIFEEKQIRTVWDEVQEKWYFCIIDIVQILTESKDYHTARKYWNKLKQRLVSEGNETVTNCHQLKLRAADGKLRYSDVADLEQMLRLVQSIPSKKAEPIKCWLAELTTTNIPKEEHLQTMSSNILHISTNPLFPCIGIISHPCCKYLWRG